MHRWRSLKTVHSYLSTAVLEWRFCNLEVERFDEHTFRLPSPSLPPQDSFLPLLFDGPARTWLSGSHPYYCECVGGSPGATQTHRRVDGGGGCRQGGETPESLVAG